MFFYLSQFLSFLALPMTIVMVFIVAGAIFIRRKWGKKSLWIGITLLLFFTNPFLSNLALLAWEPEFKSFDEIENHEIGIVLTGVTNLGKTAYDRTFFNKGADRITHALQLYRMGKIKKILITGGQGLNPVNPQSEAEVLKRFLLMTGMPESDILIEDQSKNTAQNAQFTKAFLEQKGISTDQEFILITSAFHMYRAKGCFDKVGLKTLTFPTDYYSHDLKYDLPSLLFPDPFSLEYWTKLVKEWIGIAMYKVAGYL
ncbi:YdcF family protein [Algoriphagus aestuariicola]|uniref:YdcF family protein n=1 Tax=Algoriphagus aestuariicola TaxID=1852016 RepID=A0ABS3BQK7_9BACT|nr:YdcF family protein [Algoriphagus aestuariicola]MBN7801582.1 YdcF family protein [Algoriphagus aestuariicola]